MPLDNDARYRFLMMIMRRVNDLVVLVDAEMAVMRVEEKKRIQQLTLPPDASESQHSALQGETQGQEVGRWQSGRD